VKAEDLPVTSPYSPNYDPEAMPSSLKDELPAEVVSYLNSKKLQLESLENLKDLLFDGPSSTDGSGDPKTDKTPLIAGEKADEQIGQQSMPRPPSPIASQLASPDSGGASSSSVVAPSTTVPVTMVYNEYGELVSAQSVLDHRHSSEMNVLQCLRILNKGFHHNVSPAPLFLLLND
jgi:hypothetical protein